MPHRLALANKPRALIDSQAYVTLRKNVQKILIRGQEKIERQKVQSYWQTGKIITRFILKRKDRADYGKQVIERLSTDLKISDSVLRRAVQFYHAYPISAPARKLTWAHYVELLPLADPGLRKDLVMRAEKMHWTRNDLRRKLKEEFGPEGREGLPSPLLAKPGMLYTYRLTQPDQVSSGRAYLLIDLGFAVCRRTYQTGLKAGTIIESVWEESKGDYKILKSSCGESQLYTYQAIVERVVDGDTLLAKIDLGFDTWSRQYLRLRGIDAPELGGPEGRRTKKFVERELARVPLITLRSSRSDKYDRYLADIWYADGRYLNQILLDEKLAVKA